MAEDSPLEDNLGAPVIGRLQQDGIHVHRGQNSGSLSLDDLGAADLSAFHGDIGVVDMFWALKGATL